MNMATKKELDGTLGTVAVILAAGEGYRLRPFTRAIPKPMLPLANRPILEHIIEAVRDAGITDVNIVVGYKKEIIKSYFGGGSDFGLNITYSEQKKQMGALHAFSCAKIGERDTLLLAGDHIILNADLKKLLKRGTDSVLIVSSKSPAKYGIVNIRGRKLRSIEPGSKFTGDTDALISTGIHFFSGSTARTLASMTSKGIYKIVDGINTLLSRGHEINIVKASTWMDAIYPWNLIEMNTLAVAGVKPLVSGTVDSGVETGRSNIASGSRLFRGTVMNGKNVIGDGSQIGPYSVMDGCSVGDNVKIGVFSVLRNCVVMDDAQIGDNCILENCVIGPGSILGASVKVNTAEGYFRVQGEHHKVKDAGAIIGPDCIVGAGVTFDAATILGSNCTVAPGVRVRGTHPDNTVID